MRSGSTVLHVVEVDGDTWDVREPGSERALSSWFSRSQAVREASDALRDGRGGTVRIRTVDGRVESVEVPAGKPPGWQLTMRPLHALLLGGMWGVLSVMMTITSVVDQERPPVSAALGAVLAAIYLGSGIAQTRRARRR